MFATLPFPNASADPTEALRVYFEICQPYTTEDVELAVRQFLAGTVKDFNPNYAPSGPKFAAQLRANAEYRAASLSSRHMLIEQFREQELDEKWQDARTPDAKAKVQSMLDEITARENARPAVDAAKAKASMEQHDRVFSGEFYQASNGQVISADLAAQLQRKGFVTFNAADDDQHDMGQAGAA